MSITEYCILLCI